MKRTVITVDGNGRLSIPSNLEDLWMSENELVDMLYVTTPKLKGIIRTGNHRLPDAKGIPSKLPIVVVSPPHFAHELESVFVGNLINLLHHFLRIDIISRIFLRGLECSMGSNINGIVRVIVLAKIIPFLCSQLLRCSL